MVKPIISEIKRERSHIMYYKPAKKQVNIDAINGKVYPKMTVDMVAPIVEDVEEIFGKDIIGGEIVERLLYVEPLTGEKVAKQEDINFYKKQRRIALHGCGVINPEDINEAMGDGAFKGLKRALNYDGFDAAGLNVVAGFDDLGSRISDGGKNIYSIEYLEQFCQENHIQVGIITGPTECAQAFCNRLIACGIKAIWNFVPIHLDVPDDVILQNENLSVSLMTLLMKLEK